MSNRVISAIGFLLGAAVVGVPVGIHLARKLRIPAPGKAYGQGAATTAAQANLRKANR